MSFQTIRSAQQTIWPKVRESLDHIRVAREAVTKDSTPAAQARARIPWNHVVANEAVWAIAKSDLLATPEAAAVVTAAREWLATTGPDMAEFPEDYDPIDFALRDAVQAYVTSFDPPANEDLRLSDQ